MPAPALLNAFAAYTHASGTTLGDLSGLQLWLDATVGVTDAGSGAVSNWADQSGNGYDVAQSTSGYRPTTGTMSQNSLNVISFDGSDDHLTSAAALSTWRFLHETTSTYFVVVNALDRGSGYGGVWFQTRPLGVLAEYGAFLGSYDPRNNLSIKNGNGTTWSMHTADSLAAGWHIVCVRHDAPNQTATWSVDGGAFASMTISNQNAPSSGQDPANAFTIAKSPFDGYFYGGFAEIGITNTLVDDSTAATQIAALNSKWAVY